MKIFTNRGLDKHDKEIAEKVWERVEHERYWEEHRRLLDRIEKLEGKKADVNALPTCNCEH